MFNKVIERTPFVSDIANDLFSNITGVPLNRDQSFVSTMRALLMDRAHDDFVNMSLSESNYDAETVEEASSETVFYTTVKLGQTPKNTNALIIHSLGDRGMAAIFSKFDNDFCSNHPDFHELSDLRQFVSKYMAARFYISESARKTIILVGEIDTRKYHFLQALLPRYFPWYFQDAPVTDEEKNLLAALTNRYAVEYERIIGKLAEKVDFRSSIIKTVLGGFEQNARSQQLRNVKIDLQNNQTRIEQNMSSYQLLIRQRDDLNIRYAGLQAIINGQKNCDSELIEYFTCNKNLTPLATSGMSFSFIVKCYLDSFDPEMYETMSRNECSHLYCGYHHPSGFDALADKKLFLDAIFSEEPVLKVRICAYYEVDARGEVSSRSGYRYPDDCDDRIPNPHLHYFNCLGNHSRYIRDCLIQGDTVRAVEQCVSSAKSLNIGEGATACRFIGDLMSSLKRIIELPDGSCVTSAEALRWLKQRDSGDKKEEEE